jgi:hypothetical protein
MREIGRLVWAAPQDRMFVPFRQLSEFPRRDAGEM